MAKIVYNSCYGGYGLSDAAIQRYAELKRLPIYKKRISGDYDYTSWYYTDRDESFSRDSIPRNDPLLAQVVEELGAEAGDDYAELSIREVPDGSRYRIDDYDGRELVILESEEVWEIA